jgi:hypothetical protein
LAPLFVSCFAGLTGRAYHVAMKNLPLAIMALVLFACTNAANENSAAPVNTPSVTVPLDTGGATQVARDMLDAALKGETARAKEFLVKAEREADGKGVSININEKANMAGYELGEPTVEGEFVIVPTKVRYNDGSKETDMELVMQKEGDQWRMNSTETIKRGLKKKLGGG